MIKRGVAYFIPCFLFLLFMGGCINYTKSETEQEPLHSQTEKRQVKKVIPGYTDFRKPVKTEVEDSILSVSVDVPQTTNEKVYPTISYSGYEVMYNTDYKIPKWVKYELLASETDGPYSRKGLDFVPDLSISMPQAEDSDYKKSGWSKGHMAPAGDFKWSSKAMRETFYFTNCCPQNGALNSGQWQTLERKVRDWANRYRSVTVVTGPLVWENTYGTIGYNKIVIPDAFFKAILAGEQSIAFVMYNHNNNENMQRCAMSVDKLEELSGIDFFSELDDDLECQIESTYTLTYWNLLR